MTVTRTYNARTGSLSVKDDRTDEERQNFELLRARSKAELPFAAVLIKLAQGGHITQQEALAWVRNGTIPSAITAANDNLPAVADRIQAEIEARRATTLRRTDIFVTALQNGLGLTDGQADTFFGVSV